MAMRYRPVLAMPLLIKSTQRCRREACKAYVECNGMICQFMIFKSICVSHDPDYKWQQNKAFLILVWVIKGILHTYITREEAECLTAQDA
jgi:hypothetical protein